MSIISKIKSLISEIESLLKKQNLQLNENNEINDLIKTKRELIKRIQNEFLGEVRGIRIIFSYLNFKKNKLLYVFLQYLQKQLYYLKNLIEKEVSLNENNDIRREIDILQFELKTILEVKNNEDFMKLIELYVKVHHNEKKVLRKHKKLINEREIEILISNSYSNYEYLDKLKKVFSTNEGILILKILKENCQNNITYEIILETGFAYGILKNPRVQQLESTDLLKFVKIFVNLKKDCQNDEAYSNILETGFAYGILKSPRVQQLESTDLLKFVKIFVNLKKDYKKSDELYENILKWGFARGILKYFKVQQLEVNKFLEIIEVFGREFSKLKNIEREIVESLIILIEKVLINLNFKDYKKKLELLINFLNKQVRNSKNKNSIIKTLENFNQDWIISYIIIYYLKYRQKSLISFIRNINIINELNLDINIRFLEKSIKPLTEMNEKELEIVFSTKENEKTNLENFYLEICSELDYKNEKELNQLKNYISQVKSKILKKEFDKILYCNYLKPLTDIFANLILNYFDNFKKSKIEHKFIQDFNLKKINYDLINEDFLEVYTMYLSDRLCKNKDIAFNLLKNYLEENCYPQKSLLKSYPYNLENNLNWVKNQFGSGFLGMLKARRFFSENREKFSVEESFNKKREEAEIKNLKHHLDISNNILKKYEIEIFDNYEDLAKYFSNKKNIENLKEKINENDFNNLELQVNSIKKILSSKTKEEISEISIYLELNPIKICLMGNKVDGSCLSFYNSDHENNYYWSVFSNMVDMNKLVFYIKDENKNIISRVLCCFNNDKTLMRFNLYSKGKIGEKYNLDKYFDVYIKKLAKKFDIKLSNELDNENLNCEDWYVDYVYKFENI